MKAKLGDAVVDIWKIGIDEPVGDQDRWVIEEFEKKRLVWSGKLVMTELEKRKLSENGMENRPMNSKERNFLWILRYVAPKTVATGHPYNICLVVAQARFPAFGQLGEYLVKNLNGSLVVYSEKKFERDIALLD